MTDEQREPETDQEIVIEPDEVVVTPAGAEQSDPADGPVGAEQSAPAGAAGHAGRSGQGARGGDASTEPGGYDEYDVASPAEPAAATEAPNYLEDLRRLQAEYVNYKRRVDRDRALATDRGVQQVVEALLPVLDDIHLAREHGDLDGPFAAVSDKLEGALGRFGVTRLGEPGVAFDPAVHEALMHVEAELPEGAETTTVVQVLQPGWKVGERVVRPARVSVADPA